MHTNTSIYYYVRTILILAVHTPNNVAVLGSLFRSESCALTSERTFDQWTLLTEKAERGLFKGNAQLKAERQLLENYAQLFAARNNVPP